MDFYAEASTIKMTNFSMADPVQLGDQLREKITELFIRVERLNILTTTTGLAVFGSLCEMVGRCCTHLAAGRHEQALLVANTIGRGVPHAFLPGRERDALETAIEEFITVLENSDRSQLH